MTFTFTWLSLLEFILEVAVIFYLLAAMWHWGFKKGFSAGRQAERDWLVTPLDGLMTRFADFDDSDHPFRKWWEAHGQFMLSGGGRRESIWAARGWIAREQLAEGAEVTGESEKQDL